MILTAATSSTDPAMAGIFITFMAMVWLVFGLGFASWGRSIARGKGRSGFTWGVACFFMGLVGVLVLLTLPRVVVYERYERYQPPQSRKARARR